MKRWTLSGVGDCCGGVMSRRTLSSIGDGMKGTVGGVGPGERKGEKDAGGEEERVALPGAELPMEGREDTGGEEEDAHPSDVAYVEGRRRGWAPGGVALPGRNG